MLCVFVLQVITNCLYFEVLPTTPTGRGMWVIYYLGIIVPRNFAEFHKLRRGNWQNLPRKHGGPGDERRPMNLVAREDFSLVGNEKWQLAVKNNRKKRSDGRKCNHKVDITLYCCVLKTDFVCVSICFVKDFYKCDKLQKRTVILRSRSQIEQFVTSLPRERINVFVKLWHFKLFSRTRKRVVYYP